MDMIAKAEGSAGKRLMQSLWTELQLQSPRLASMNAEAQGEVLDRLRLTVDEAVREAVSEIAGASFERVPVSIDSMTFKDGVKIVLKSSLVTEAVLHVAEEVGSAAMLVLCDASQFTGDLHEIKPRPDQRDLVGDGEGT